MNEMMQGNAGNKPTETAIMKRIALDIVQLLEPSDDDQANVPDHNGFGNVETEGHDIPTINLTSHAIIYYVIDHIYTEHYTGNKSTSFESAHDTDSTFSSVINIDDIIIQDIISDQVEWKSELITASLSSGPNEHISIDESDNDDPPGRTYFEKTAPSKAIQECHQD